VTANGLIVHKPPGFHLLSTPFVNSVWYPTLAGNIAVNMVSLPVFMLVAVFSKAAAAPIQFDSYPLVPQLHQILFVERAEHTIYAYRLSRDTLQARWSESWHEHLPCTKPKRDRHIQKTGLGTQSPTLKLRIKESGVYVDDQLPIYVGCQVRFLYADQLTET
jgi:hypothetical protein